jgi:hypothetical protein
MSPTLPPSLLRAATLAGALAAVSALAAPGAHGPNGEHLDGPAQQASASTAPRLEAKSELFELVATLSGGELSMLVDRFDTNEPVLGAKLEVESGAHKAIARFHADHGDYAIDDAAFLQALARPGEHPLVITVTSGAQADLLEGTLRVVAPAADDHGHGLQSPRVLAAGGALLLAAGGTAAFLVRRRRSSVGGRA